VIAIFGAGAAFTVIVSVEELFAAFVSPGVETVAVLLTLPVTVDDTATTNEILPAAPAAAIGPGFVQVTVCPAAEHDHAVPAAETNVMPVGNVSVTVMTPVVADVPALVTAMVYVPLLPAVKVAL
jgi:hypothetical protein